MQNLYEGIELTAEQNEWICRGLLDLAAVDGVDASEIELVREFYRMGTGNEVDLDALAAKGFDLDKAAAIVKAGGDTLVEAFFVSCYMLIYADGHHSDAERKRIGEFAVALDLDSAELEALHLKSRLFLLEELAANLRNRQIIEQIAINLGLTADQVAGLTKD